MSHDDLMLALALADRADELTRVRFGALDLRIDTKPDLTPVTDADRAVESDVRQTLGRDRPGDGVLGEEFGGSTTFTGRQWIVDPIDGTKNFVRGVPVWASLIALLEDGVPSVGVVSAPALQRRWWAARGRARSHPSMVRVHTGCRFPLWQSCIRRACRFPVCPGGRGWVYVNASSG